MIKPNRLGLTTGNDLAFDPAGLVIHQPKAWEIGLVEEENFYSGLSLLTVTKDQLKSADNEDLRGVSNFDIFMSVMQDRSTSFVQIQQNYTWMVLALLFPKYKLNFTLNGLCFQLEDSEDKFYLNGKNFAEFQSLIQTMFCLLRSQETGSELNPSGKLANEIASKLQKARQKKNIDAGLKGTSVIGRYISILSVGCGIPITQLKNYTVYQLFESYERYILKIAYDVNMQVRLAGAKDVEEVENWMKDLHRDEDVDEFEELFGSGGFDL